MSVVKQSFLDMGWRLFDSSVFTEENGTIVLIKDFPCLDITKEVQVRVYLQDSLFISPLYESEGRNILSTFTWSEKLLGEPTKEKMTSYIKSIELEISNSYGARLASQRRVV